MLTVKNLHCYWKKKNNKNLFFVFENLANSPVSLLHEWLIHLDFYSKLKVWETVCEAKGVNRTKVYYKIVISACNCQIVQTVWKSSIDFTEE